MHRPVLSLLIALTLIACDPLAPDPGAARILVVTPTTAPTRTQILQPTDVPTATTAVATADPNATLVTSATQEATSGATQDTSALPTQIAQIGTAASETPTALPATAIPTSAVPLPTNAPVKCTQTSGLVVDMTIQSKVARVAMRYKVYLPPCYAETRQRYPYVILMHGSDADDAQWTKTMKANEILDNGISLGALAPMILIMPNGGNLANLNVFEESKSWESFMLTELIPDVEKNFCVWTEPQGRAIGGISRGGFWAYLIGLRAPQLFSTIGGHSAFFDFGNAPPTHNPLSLAKTVNFAAGKQPRLWLDSGRYDYARPNIEIFQKTLVDRGIDVAYTRYPDGGHTIQTWQQHAAEYIAFYGQNWPRDVAQLPSCMK